MTPTFLLDLSNPQTDRLLDWLREQVENDQRKLEDSASHDESQMIRGRLKAWRTLLGRAERREVFVDGRPA